MRLLLALAALLLAACGSRPAPRAAAAPGPPPPDWAAISGEPYTLESLTVGGEAVPVTGERRPTMQFTPEGRLGGFAGVNRYSAGAAAPEPGRLTLTGAPISTRMAGPPEAMRLETRFLDALQKVRNLSWDGPLLVLTDPEGTVRITLRR